MKLNSEIEGLTLADALQWVASQPLLTIGNLLIFRNCTETYLGKLKKGKTHKWKTWVPKLKVLSIHDSFEDGTFKIDWTRRLSVEDLNAEDWIVCRRSVFNNYLDMRGWGAEDM